MTEADITQQPLTMPLRFLPYLEKFRLYKLFKDMVEDLVINLPKDHLKHMKLYLTKDLYSTKDVDRVILLTDPEVKIDKKLLAKQLIKHLGCFVITRRCVIDRYEKHEDYEEGCISPALLSKVTKCMADKDPVPQTGWLMYDHPCTLREARCLQQDGVLPTVTLVLMMTPPTAQPVVNDRTPARTFFQQDFEGLKFAYKATLKEVHIDPDDDITKISNKCLNAVQACRAGSQGPKQGLHVVGAPGVYRVVLLGPRGSGRRTQGRLLAKHFGLVYLNFGAIFNEAKARDDDLGERIRKFGTSFQVRAETVKQRLMRKDCIDHGWVLTGYPCNGNDFEHLDQMATPPNRIIFLSVTMATCKQRAMAHGVDPCTGKSIPYETPGALRHPQNEEEIIDYELDYYFSEALAELRAAAGITAQEVDASEPTDKVQVKIQAAVIAAPAFDIYVGCQLRNVCGD